MSLIYSKIKNNRGFTLAETVVYAALFVVVSSLIVNFVLSVAGLLNYGKAEKEASRGGRIIMDGLAHEIRLASLVDADGSILDVSPGKLVLNTFQTATSSIPATEEIYLSGDKILLSVNGGEPVSLSGDVKVNSLIFNRLISPNSEAVRVSITVESGAGKFKKQKDYVVMAILRNSYQ